MSELRGSCMTVGELRSRLKAIPDSCPIYFWATNNAPCIVENWNAEGECEGIDITAGLEHGE